MESGSSIVRFTFGVSGLMLCFYSPLTQLITSFALDALLFSSHWQVPANMSIALSVLLICDILFSPLALSPSLALPLDVLWIARVFRQTFTLSN